MGPDFVISCRVSQWAEWDYDAKVAGTPEELALLVGTLEAEGADMINVSTRYFHNPEWPQHDERSLAGWVKEIATKPVATVGSVGLDVDLMQTLYSDKQEQQTLQTSLTELVSRFADGEFDLVSAQFLHSPGDMPRERILRTAAGAVAPGGVLLVVGHAEHPMGEHAPDHDVHLPTAREVLDSLELPEDEWEVQVCEEYERPHTGPDGEPSVRRDTIVKVRRATAR